MTAADWAVLAISLLAFSISLRTFIRHVMAQRRGFHFSEAKNAYYPDE
jgi:hypothetical protein